MVPSSYFLSVSLAVVIPFYAASVVETVQSDIASEKPGIFDVFQEGISRFLSWSAPQTGEWIELFIRALNGSSSIQVLMSRTFNQQGVCSRRLFL